MKLPEDRNERIKLYVLGGVFGLFVLYLGGSYAVKPLLNQRAEWQTQIAKLKLDIDTTQRVLDFVGQSREADKQVVDEILLIAQASNAVLRARLGNYQLEAEERIMQRAAAVGVSVADIKQGGIAPAPWAEEDQSAFKVYSARVETECGLHDLARLLREFQRQNPYVCIAALSIDARGATPAQHAVSFDVQWPIWENENALEEITQGREAADKEP